MRRQQVRAWNQYFTPASEANAVMDVARKILAQRLQTPTVWVEPAAGAGDICGLFPPDDDDSRSVCIEIDPTLCSERGWLNRDFLTLAREDVFGGSGQTLPATADVIVVTNPPFVGYAESVEGKTIRDGKLAHAFVRHSLQLGDVVVMLLPKRFVRQDERDAAIRGCHQEERVVSRVHGAVRQTRFELGAERYKKITQPCVIVSFVRERIE